MTPLKMDLVVQRKWLAATDIAAFELASPTGAPLPPFEPGAHVDVEIGPGMVRQYSLCNDSRERHRYLIGVLREPASRGGSARLYDGIAQGDHLRVGSPRNHFPLADSASCSLLFAGGIGITPILSMAYCLNGRGQVFSLHYCARSHERAAFLSNIETLTSTGHAIVHYDEGPDDQKLNLDQVLRGYDVGKHVYVCGPAGYISWVLDTARALGWPEETLHREYFAPTAPSHGSAGGAFKVRLANRGVVVDVLPDQSVAEAIVAAGIGLPMSCEQGICGSCVVRVLEGIPEHRDSYLTESEKVRNDQMTLCVSRSCSPVLVLDI